MDAKDLEYFRQLILRKREELLRQIQSIRESTIGDGRDETLPEQSGYTYHMADVGTDTEEREKAFYFASREGNLLWHLDQALLRIERGEYGICVSCGKPISRERLEAVPHARLCIDCKNKEERR
ncbi:MAG: TraR/DksA C4-type zinc finger protein [candidate division KSB1 bacterium]|nr:TraR/DksA C4-type zinc finger protein [candidate division KSB1 bacterium]